MFEGPHKQKSGSDVENCDLLLTDKHMCRCRIKNREHSFRFWEFLPSRYDQRATMVLKDFDQIILPLDLLTCHQWIPMQLDFQLLGLFPFCFVSQ